MINKSVPGKVILAGEYGLLVGMRGIVVAVDRFAHGTFVKGPRTLFSFKASGPQRSNNHHRILYSAERALTAFGLSFPMGHYTIDTSDFYSNGRKIGLGSSAAASVALASLAVNAQQIDDPSLLFELAKTLHDFLQNEDGSGADIAASIVTGASIYHRNNSPQLIVEQKLDLDFLWNNLIFVDTKRPQSTRDFVAQFKKSYEQDRTKILSILLELESLALRLINPTNESLTIEVLRRLTNGLRQLGKACQIDIVSPIHEQIIEAAQALQGAAKPTGAGGGDIALVYVPAKNRHDFFSFCSTNGWEVLRLAVFNRS